MAHPVAADQFCRFRDWDVVGHAGETFDSNYVSVCFISEILSELLE